MATPPRSSHDAFRYHCRGSAKAAASVTLGAAGGAPLALGATARGRDRSAARGSRTVSAASRVIQPQPPPSSA
jgi:hypothetical protein